MPRVREFDLDAVVAKAVAVFWEKGYEETSVGDLVDATGLSRSSLYGEFGDKRGVFLHALRAYRSEEVPQFAAPLMEDDADLLSVRSYFMGLVEMESTPGCSNGCLVCLSAIELARFDAEVAMEVEEMFAEREGQIRRALTNGKSKGQLREETDPEQAAAALTAMLQAGGIMVRGPGNHRRLEALWRSMLESL